MVAHVGKTPYVRFDLNDYSIPHDHVRRAVTIRATATSVRIIDGTELIANHPRYWGKAMQIEEPSHIKALATQKMQAREMRGMDRLHHACPACTPFFAIVAERGANLGATTVGLIRLLDAFGATALDAALTQAVADGISHLGALRHLLDSDRQRRNQPPPVELHLSDKAIAASKPVQSHCLSSYDAPALLRGAP